MSVTVLSRPLDVHSGDRERVLAKSTVQNLLVDLLDQLAGGDLPCFEVQNESDDDARDTDADSPVEGVVNTSRTIAKRLVLPTVEAGVGEIAQSMNACVSYARYASRDVKQRSEPAVDDYIRRNQHGNGP